MPFSLNMPKLSPTMEEGLIEKWHVSVNDHVEAGDLLFEVSTDKATVEYNAIDEGYLRKIIAKEGETVSVNQPVAVFSEEKDEDISSFEPKRKIEKIEEAKEIESETDEKKQEIAPAKKEGTISEPVFKPPAPFKDVQFPFSREPIEGRLFASPLAKKIAKEKQLDLRSVKGSGPGGRIMSRDLDLAQPEVEGMFSFRSKPTIPAGSYKEETMSPMRKTIAKRLQEAKSFIPHFYVSQEVNAEHLINVRNDLKEGGIHVTFNDLLIRASALALKKHPRVNSGYNSENKTIIYYETIDISVAVNVPEGLVTPIIRYADFKSVGEISKEIKELAARAKKGKLEPQEYQGGSFTLSNMGMYGITDFKAIINQPQSAILAVGGILDKPVVKDGHVVPGKIMTLTLSADHRIVDGALGAEFMRTMKQIVEHPSLLLLNP